MLTKKTLHKILSSTEPKDLERENFAKAAVLIPVFEKNGSTHLLFTKRTETVKHHKGQISFPGGAYDEKLDKSLEDTSFRETFEEIGVKSHQFSLLGRLDSSFTVTNFVVTPFVAQMEYPVEYKLNPEEVERILEIPLSHLLDEKASEFTTNIVEYQGRNYTVYSWMYKGDEVWGATGRILNVFLDLIREHI